MTKYYIEDWDKISDDEQQEILSSLKKAGSLKETDEILNKPDQNQADQASPEWDPRHDICVGICNASFIAAAAACAEFGGIAFGVCMATAAEARERCKDSC